MKKQSSWLIVLVLVVSLLLAACGGGDKDDKGGSASVPVVEIRPYTDWTLTVVSTDPRLDMELALLAAYPEYAPDYDDSYDVAAGSFYDVLLSPDGEYLVAMGRFDLVEPDDDGDDDHDVICRYTIADAAMLCWDIEREFRGVSSTPGLSAWSWDGTRLVMHEDLIRRGRDSDLWLVDVESMTHINLTDDRYYGTWFSADEDENPTLDHLPLWSPNGDLYFFRLEDTGDDLIDVLYRIEGGIGGAERVLEMPDDMANFDLYGTAHAAMSPDGTQIALLPMLREQPLTRGVWIIDLAAGTVEELVPAADLQFAVPASEMPEDVDILLIPQDIAWSLDGRTLFVATDNPIYSTAPVTLNMLAIDVASKDVVALMDYSVYEDTAAMVEHLDELPYYPWILTPDRGTVIYAPRRPANDEFVLYAVPATFDQEPVVLATLPKDMFGELIRGIEPYDTGLFAQTGANGNILVGRVLFKVE